MANKGLTFYKVRSNKAAPKALTVTKYDQDIEVMSEYHMTWFEGKDKGYYDCACPAAKFNCRHKDILEKFQTHNQIDGDKFYCFEAGTFKTLEELGK